MGSFFFVKKVAKSFFLVQILNVYLSIFLSDCNEPLVIYLFLNPYLLLSFCYKGWKALPCSVFYRSFCCQTLVIFITIAILDILGGCKIAMVVQDQ